MKRIFLFLALVCVVLLSRGAVLADGFYVIAGGGKAGTQINSVPYTINSPGLYCLAKNFTSSSTSDSAITVAASDVTLDLMGYCLTGPGKTSGGNVGIKIQPTCSDVEIRNGSVNGFGNFGVYSSDSTINGVRIIGLRVRDTGGAGIILYGNGHLVMGCTVQNVGGPGIFLSGSGSLCKGNQAFGNNGYGIYVYGGIVAGNVCLSNIYGILADTGSSVLDNQVMNNTANGIIASTYCTITRNTARGNPSGGIITSAYCTITNNTTQGLTYGSNCTLADNTVY